MKMKYVTFARGGQETAVMFSDHVIHADMAARLRHLGEPVGAGFCFSDDGEMVAYGESISLRLKSRGDEDSRLLTGLYG